MSKMSIETERQALSGPTMGTRWSALFYTTEAFGRGSVRDALQAAVDEVDAQMSTWRPDSDLMRLNAAPPGAWVEVPKRLMEVLRLALDIGRASGGAFDIGMGDAVAAWGFGPAAADQRLIRNAFDAARQPSDKVLDLDMPGARVRKTVPITLDLNGIAKGYGVDRLAETLRDFGISSGLVGIDGEMRALGLRPNGQPWAIAIEAPDPDRRASHSLLALQDAAVATSGDYRHVVTVQGQRLSHTMDPMTGAPLRSSPASVTVVASSCAEADAWATALMVLGSTGGGELAARHGLDVLFLIREANGFKANTVGPLFDGGASTGGRSGAFCHRLRPVRACK
jgi:thiamine biosynthesis lipoprotein